MAKAKSKTPAKSSRAPSAKKSKGIDHKQQSALHRGGSLAQRNSSESTIGPEADVPDEITSAAPPNVPALDEAGRASSPMFDEVPTTGKGSTAHPGAPMPAPKKQKVKTGEGEAGDEGQVADIKALEDLPAGTTVLILADEIQIQAAIAGGARKVFHGKTAKAALQSFNDFAENGVELFPSGRTEQEEKDFQAQNKEAEKAATKRAAEAEAEKKKAEG